MTSSSYITISVVVGLLNLVALMIVLILPYWRVNSVVASEPHTVMNRYYEGIWVRCTALMQNAYYNCDMYDESIIGLPVSLTVLRALMVISVIFSVVGVSCSALGLRCTTALKEGSKQKRWVVIVGGVCHIFSGVFTGICVSWYAAEVVYQYYSPYYAYMQIKYTLGTCLYVGWICMTLSLVCGCLMACCACFSKPVDSYEETKAYTYKPPVPQVEKDQYKMTPPPVHSVQPSYKPMLDDYREKSYSFSGNRPKSSSFSNGHRPKSSSFSNHHRSTHRHSSHHRDGHSNQGSRRSSFSRDGSHHQRHDTLKSNRQDSDIVQESGYV